MITRYTQFIISWLQYTYIHTHVSYIIQLQVQLQSEEMGKHLSEVETLLQQHQMLETSLEAHKQHIALINQQANEYSDKRFASSNAKCKLLTSVWDVVCLDFHELLVLTVMYYIYTLYYSVYCHSWCYYHYHKYIL